MAAVTELLEIVLRLALYVTIVVLGGIAALTLFGILLAHLT